MPKKKASEKTDKKLEMPDIFNAGKNPKNEKAFLKEFTDAVAEIVRGYSLHFERLPFLTTQSELHKEGYYSMTLTITDGLFSLIPCVPNEISEKKANKYAKDIEEIAEKLGDDVDEWPDETIIELCQENMLYFTICPVNIRKNKADFALGLSIICKEMQEILVMPGIGPVNEEKEPLIKSWSRDPGELEEEVYKWLGTWLFNSQSWITMRVRRIEAYARFQNYIMHNNAPGWEYEVAFIPKKFLINICWITSSDDLEILKPTPFTEKCASIIGDFFHPGKSAAFCIIYELDNKEGMIVTVRGPFAFIASHYDSLREIMDRCEKSGEIFKEFVPEQDFDSRSIVDEASDGKEVFVSKAGQQAIRILKKLGFTEH